MMQLKLVCECGTINDSDAKYCKTCGKDKDGTDISKGITKLAELAKLKDTWRCYRCECEIAGPGLCTICSNILTKPSTGDISPYKPVQVYC